MNTRYDIVVIGAGHAGIEAAAAAAKLGCRTACITMPGGRIGQMSCNPAIGGVAKGHLTREIDALGGLMGLAIDAVGIQFRRLNTRKGAAVRATRAQADRKLYADDMTRRLSQIDGLTIIEDEVVGLLVESDTSGAKKILGVTCAVAGEITAQRVIITTGTFLRGLMHVGNLQTEGGRTGERASNGLSRSLLDAGIKLGRLKTGTPARIALNSIDFTQLDEQPGDDPAPWFSFMTDGIEREQISCWLTRTTEHTHDVIRANLERSPLFGGAINGTGPRYCPSIEDKVVRFPDKTSHTVFLEPEGFDSNVVYPNGISTSLPQDVQESFLRSIPGLEECEILALGYAVEYDFAPPTQLNRNLESKVVGGLFCAGQINGTSGYEEAAGQGIMAGINAALSLQGREPLILGRDQAYIGVLIDDLVTVGTKEPYRMFTSRAEYRLLLREDNADERLTPVGRDVDLVEDERLARFEQKQREKEFLRVFLSGPIKRETAAALCKGAPPHTRAEALKRPEVDIHRLIELESIERDCTREVREAVEIDHKYAGYIEKQQAGANRLRKSEHQRLPQNLRYADVRGLSTEVIEKLEHTRPETLGQALRISGVTPAAIGLLQVHLRRRSDTPA